MIIISIYYAIKGFRSKGRLIRCRRIIALNRLKRIFPAFDFISIMF
ncbi:hypothetical protein NEISICOT_01727 [Neisseria sicca ATCC 29256]|uniref:Uncharacterized protein n=1 Tax=Neisseria sicca ATCC 29256 TaxID=547045 RepID=C6M5C8_NEISI|nr:hypothetical protein NEISICOT_01727 [Neisseria sicca ATCC 29256]